MKKNIKYRNMKWIIFILLILIILFFVFVQTSVDRLKGCREKLDIQKEMYEQLQDNYQIRSREVCELECPIEEEDLNG